MSLTRFEKEYIKKLLKEKLDLIEWARNLLMENKVRVSKKFWSKRIDELWEEFIFIKNLINQF